LRTIKTLEYVMSETKLKRLTDLTKEDVLRIWTMRAGKQKNRVIAKEIGCYEWVSSDVINRGIGPEIPIPHGIRKAALETTVKRGPKGSRHEQIKVIEQAGAEAEAHIPAFFSACLHAEQSRAKCLRAGVSEDTLNLIQLAAQEQAGTTRKSP
jgi:hypothetical protein